MAEYDEGRELKTPSPRSGMMQRVESLVSLGKSVFADAIPATIRREVLESNVKFLNERDLFSAPYMYELIQPLVSRHDVLDGEAREAALTAATVLVTRVLLHTVYPVGESLRGSFDGAALLKSAMADSQAARDAFCTLVLADQALLQQVLLGCPEPSVRTNFATCIAHAVGGQVAAGEERPQHALIRALVDLLPVAVRAHLEAAAELFRLVSDFVKDGRLAVTFAVVCGVFGKVLELLAAGPGAPPTASGAQPPSGAAAAAAGAMPWTTSQIGTLESLYTIIRTVFMAHDLSSIRSPPPDGLTADGAMTLPLPEVVRVELVEHADRLIAVLIRGIALEDALQAMQHCSIENPAFSDALFTSILRETAVAELLKPVFDALLRLLQTEDSLQDSRIVAFYEGDGSVQGLLSLASSCRGANPKRAYQYIKFVVRIPSHPIQWAVPCSPTLSRTCCLPCFKTRFGARVHILMLWPRCSAPPQPVPRSLVV